MSTEVGTYLFKRRSEKGWSLREASKRLDISPSRLSEIEKGISKNTNKTTLPSRETIEKLAQGYKIPEDLLLKKAGFLPKMEEEKIHATDELLELMQLVASMGVKKQQIVLAVAKLIAQL